MGHFRHPLLRSGVEVEALLVPVEVEPLLVPAEVPDELPSVLEGVALARAEVELLQLAAEGRVTPWVVQTNCRKTILAKHDNVSHVVSKPRLVRRMRGGEAVW